MKVDILVSRLFRRKAKHLIKKYISLKSELATLNKDLLTNPQMGTAIGNDCYKIRLAVKSKGKGKSGGLRIITHLIVQISQETEDHLIVSLVTIYDKSEYENISHKELAEMLSEVKAEIEAK